jgi:chemotaxis protein CheD
MTSLLKSPPGAKTSVGMGQIALGRDGDRLDAVLGSCVGIVLFHPRFPVAVLAHVVLPDSNGRGGAPGKFVDTAVPELLRLLALADVPRAGLVAKLAGGANMFGGIGGPLQIGEQNKAAATKLLSELQIPVIASDLGGGKGRHICVDCQMGLVTVEVIGQDRRVL